MVERKAHKTRKDSLDADEKVLWAFSLRLKGYTYDQIAEEMGLNTRAMAYKYVDREVKRRREELAECADKVIEQEVARLDQMLLALQPHIERGSDRHIDKALKIQERRSKLLGLDAPTKQEVTGKGGGPLQVESVSLDASQLDDDTLAKIMAARSNGDDANLGDTESSDESA